jgi:hypothetical protein
LHCCLNFTWSFKKKIFFTLRAKRSCVSACKKLHSMLALLLHYSEVVNIQPRAAFHSHYVNSCLPYCRVHFPRVANKFLSFFVVVLHFEWKFLWALEKKTFYTSTMRARKCLQTFSIESEKLSENEAVNNFFMIELRNFLCFANCLMILLSH